MQALLVIEYRNRLNHLIRYSKRSYFKSLIEKTQGNLHATRNAINEILNKRKPNTSDVSVLEHSGQIYKDNKHSITFSQISGPLWLENSQGVKRLLNNGSVNCPIKVFTKNLLWIKSRTIFYDIAASIPYLKQKIYKLSSDDSLQF